MAKSAPKAVRMRALDLLRSGKSLRTIEEQLRAEGTPLSKSTLGELWRRRPERAERAPAPERAPSPERQPGPERAPEPDAPDAPGVSTDVDLSGAADLDVGELTRLAKRISRRVEQALEEDDWRALPTLIHMRLQIASSVARVRPPPQVDPEADPGNIGARELLRARLALLVEQSQTKEVRAAIRAQMDNLDAKERT